MTILPAQFSHIDRLAELEALCFSMPWSRAMLEAELSSSIGFYVAAELDAVVAGYAGMQVIAPEGYITNVAVDPLFRRRGVGDALLRALIERAKTLNLALLTLEVRQSNLSAQSLYAKHGFAVVGLRPFYYEKPRENALLMTLTLDGGLWNEHSGL